MRVIWLAFVLSATSLFARPQDDPGQVAMSLEKQGNIVEAETAWSKLSKEHPSNPEPLAHLGLLEARQEHYSEAIAYYRRAMALSPAMPGLRLNLGIAYFKSGDYQQTIRALTPLLKAQPGDQRLTILIGMSHYGLSEFAAAAPYLKQAAEKDAQNLPLLLTVAHSCLFSHQYQCVLDEFHRIIALDPQSAEADMLMGEALDEMKDPIGATREFRAAVKANPKEPKVHFGLGYLLWTQGQTQEAAQEFQAELENDPEDPQAILYLADSQIQMNRMEDAQPLLEKTVKTNPGNAMGHLDLGIIYTESGRQQEAMRELRMAAALDPKDVKAHWRLARLYRAMGKTVEANVELAKSKDINKAADEGLLKAMSKVPGQDKQPRQTPGAPAEK